MLGLSIKLFNKKDHISALDAVICPNGTSQGYLFLFIIVLNDGKD